MAMESLLIIIVVLAVLLIVGVPISCGPCLWKYRW